MSEWFRHDLVGRITTVGTCPDGDVHYYEYADEVLVVDVQADAHRHWYDTDTQQLELREPPAITVDGHTVVGIPVPSVLDITGPAALSATLDEPTLELTFDVPGVYTLRFKPEHPRWLEATVTIEVSE